MEKTIPWQKGLFVVALLLILLTGCSARSDGGAFGDPGEIETVRLKRGPLTVMIGATGLIRSAQSATVTWQTSGRVGEVNAVFQQEVTAGETLASLDPTSLPQNILQAQVDLINARRNLDELLEPDPLAIAQAQDALEQAQEALDDLLNPSAVAIAEAEIAVINAQDALEDAQYQVDRLQWDRGSAEQINLARANYLLAQEKVDRMQQIYNDTSGSSKEDPAKALALSNLEGAKADRDRALGTLNWYLGEPSETEVAEKYADLALAEGRLADAEETLNNLKNPTETVLTLARARVADAEEALDRLINGPSDDDLTIAQTRITQAQAALNQASLTAPFDGTIDDVMVLPGDLVSPGSPAFRVDDLSALYIDLEVSEVDVYQVKVGQPVSVTLDAILDQVYQGEVTQIGQVGVANPQGAVSFPVSVRLTDPGDEVRPGMTAVANIVVAEADDILQLPNRAIQEDDGKRFVYVQPPGGGLNEVREVYIRIGLSSDTASEVISTELNEGDTVIVSLPDLFMMSRHP